MKQAKCATLAVLVMLAGRSTADETKKQASARLKERLGEKGLAVLEGATRVETFRIKPNRDPKATEAIAGYPLIAAGKQLDARFARQLADVLLDDKTWFGESARCFLPGVVFRVWKDR